MKSPPYLFKLLLEPRLTVFLCGPERKYIHSDIRTKVKRFLTQKANVNCFLGEDIEEVRLGKDNHLKIESEHARKSDVIIVFLGSPGTFAELGAFTLDPLVRSRLVVFNGVEYKGKKSFVNDGPIKWLKDYQVVWYDHSRDSDNNVFHLLDFFLLRIRHSKVAHLISSPFDIFCNYMLYVALRIHGESDYEFLEHHSGLTAREVRDALAALIAGGYAMKVGKRYRCSKIKTPGHGILFKPRQLSSLSAENLADQY